MVKKDAQLAPRLTQPAWAQPLSRAGLDDKEIKIINVLLEFGEMRAGEIAASVALKRGDTYNHLYSLKQRGLIEEVASGGWKRFRLEHPSKVEEYLERRSRELTEAQKGFAGALPAILSAYNLSYHKPGVKVFEGEEAVRTVLGDTLKAKSEILAFIDLESIEKFIPEISAQYGKQRDRLKKWKYNLVFNSSFNREFLKTHSRGYTEDRIINYPLNQAGVSLHIYDTTASFMTLKPKSKIGVIIDDALIVNLLRGIFRASWENAKPVKQLKGSSEQVQKRRI